MNKKIFNIIAFQMFLIFGIGVIAAIGVGSAYSSNLPLMAYPGEEVVVALNLQNTDIDGDIILEGTLLEGSEIASLEKGPYTVPYGDKTAVEMNVKIPSSANIGDVYSVVYEFNQAGGDAGDGMVGLNQNIIRRFNVEVIEKPVEPTEEAEGIGLIWWILAVIVVIVVAGIWFFVKSKK